MKIRIDPESDALYLRLTETPIKHSEEVAPGVIIDFDATDEPVGVEILELRRRYRPEDLAMIQTDLFDFVAAASR